MISFSQNELYQEKQGGNQEEIITDSNFTIQGVKKKKYHFECQSSQDNSMLVRMFEYGAELALRDGELKENSLTVTFPHSAVLYLRSTRNTPKYFTLNIETPGDSLEYKIPTMKMQDYSFEELMEKKLYFLLPFLLFNYEKNFPKYEEEEEELQRLVEHYQSLSERLEELVQAGEMSEFSKCYLMDMSNKVLQHLAGNYEKIRKGVGQVMSGTILRTETSDIFDEGVRKGLQEGRQEGIKGLIASLQGFGFTERVIKAELIKRYSLSEAEAIEYLNG